MRRSSRHTTRCLKELLAESLTKEQRKVYTYVGTMCGPGVVSNAADRYIASAKTSRWLSLTDCRSVALSLTRCSVRAHRPAALVLPVSSPAASRHPRTASPLRPQTLHPPSTIHHSLSLLRPNSPLLTSPFSLHYLFFIPPLTLNLPFTRKDCLCLQASIARFREPGLAFSSKPAHRCALDFLMLSTLIHLLL